MCMLHLRSFVTFDSPDSAAECAGVKHNIGGHDVEVKRAVPREATPGGTMGRGGPAPRGRGGFGAFGAGGGRFGGGFGRGGAAYGGRGGWGGPMGRGYGPMDPYGGYDAYGGGYDAYGAAGYGGAV